MSRQGDGDTVVRWAPRFLDAGLEPDPRTLSCSRFQLWLWPDLGEPVRSASGPGSGRWERSQHKRGSDIFGAEAAWGLRCVPR